MRRVVESDEDPTDEDQSDEEVKTMSNREKLQRPRGKKSISVMKKN